MNDRTFNTHFRCLLGILLLLYLGDGLKGQCTVPPTISCAEEITLTLRGDCQLELLASMLLPDLPACLADSNFTITVEDGTVNNGPLAAGPGRYRYVVTGRHHPELIGFSCTGFVTLQDASPPEIELLPGPIDRSCKAAVAADINLLPAAVSRCYVIDGASGLPRPGSLDDRLARALLAGGGVPVVSDACGGDVEVCVNDAFDVPNPSACLDTVTLQRSFQARSIDGNPNFAPAFRAQTIRFIRPRIAQLRGVERFVSLTCTSSSILANPLPRNGDYPFFSTNSGNVHVTEGFCEFAVDYIDGSRTFGCGNNYSFVRTFRVRDWCNGNRDTLFNQIVQVGDFAGPSITLPVQDLNFDGEIDAGPLTYSTNTGACAAVIDLAAGVELTDNCSNSLRLDAYVFLNGNLATNPLGPYRVIGGVTNSLSAPLPVGEHLLRFEGRDACNNVTTADSGLRIVDGNPPRVVCVTDMDVSLNNSGVAVLPAINLDGGSRDDCSDVDFLVAKVNADDLPTTVPDERVRFSCNDLGPQRLVLIGRDQSGNENRCWVNLVIEDRTAPSCVAPAAVSWHCQLYAAQFPEDLPAAYAADPVGIGARLDRAFGTATGIDNCSLDTVTQVVVGELNSCGSGQFFRQFRVTDGAGFTQNNNCIQTIDVLPLTEYTLRFPGDQNYTCGELPDPEDFTRGSAGCELFSFNTFRDTLNAPIPGSCYALQLTHEVINWCEYDGQSPPFTLPRDADGNGNFREPLFLNVRANTPNDYLDDQAVLDRDDTPGNGNDLGQLADNYGTSSQRGYFRYQQVVGILDDEAPDLMLEAPDDGLAFTEDCLGGVALILTAFDDCGDVDVRVTIDENLVDRNGDGAFGGTDFNGEYDIPEVRFTGDVATGLTVPVRNLPIGQHLARVRVTDDCGNQTQEFVVMQVNDGRAPEPICIGAISVNLVPDIVAGGINTVWATDFVGRPAITCTETSVSYSLYREEEAAVQGFIPQQNVFNVEVDCADVGSNILRLYAFAENTGRNAFCNVVLMVRDASGLCEERMGEISGLVLDHNGDPMHNVEIFNNGPSSLVSLTEADGSFRFDGLAEQVDYTVRPYLDANPINGLSTADLNIIGRRLIGIDDNLTPYQLIAADANNNGSITVRDLIAIREVILGFQDDFENNNSWRFVTADYVFPDPGNPWLEPFPEVATFNNLMGAAFTEFIAIKIGDVTGNADPRVAFSLAGAPEASNAAGVALLTLRPEAAGVWGLYAPQSEGFGTSTTPAGGAIAGARFSMTAVQAALQLPAGTRLLPGLLSPAEYRVGKGNVLRLSRVAVGHQLNTNEPLLRFRVSGDELPHLLPATAGFAPEAYTGDYQTLPLGLAVQTALPLGGSPLRATPSPFRESTELSVVWPVAEQLELTVYDLAGRAVYQATMAGEVGPQQWVVSRHDLGDRPGVYVVRVAGRSGEQVLRMVLQ